MAKTTPKPQRNYNKPYWMNKENKCEICGILISNNAKRCNKHANLGKHYKRFGGNEQRKCIQCDTIFYTYPSRRKQFCSHSCARIGNINGFTKEKVSGPKNINWKGGISRNLRPIWGEEYKWWRKQVFERDGCICQWCGSSNHDLQAHHIKSWSRFPELRYNIDNGITLCKICHSHTDNYGGKGSG